MHIIIEKWVGITAMVGGLENEDNAAIYKQVPATPYITGNIWAKSLNLICAKNPHISTCATQNWTTNDFWEKQNINKKGNIWPFPIIFLLLLQRSSEYTVIISRLQLHTN